MYQIEKERVEIEIHVVVYVYISALAQVSALQGRCITLHSAICLVNAPAHLTEISSLHSVEVLYLAKMFLSSIGSCLESP